GFSSCGDRSGRGSSQRCSTGRGLSGFVDCGTREPQTPAGNQQPKNKQQRWYQQGQFDGSGSTLIPCYVAMPVDDHGGVTRSTGAAAVSLSRPRSRAKIIGAYAETSAVTVDGVRCTRMEMFRKPPEPAIVAPNCSASAALP